MIRNLRVLFLLLAVAIAVPMTLHAAAPSAAASQDVARSERAGGEASLVLPDLGSQTFLGTNGRTLLMGGLLVCVLGLAFGMTIFRRLRNMPVHRSMLEVSELIYETCKTYLVTQ